MDPTSKTDENIPLPEEYGQGFAQFLGCKIDLTRRVLIPRPETEFWTQAAIDDLKKNGRPVSVLDIFSGSGCVGVAVAKNVPSARVDFSDIDENAIAQIKINLETNGINESRARVFRSDIFENLPAGLKYDAILANPPYIDPARIGEVQDSVLEYEPHGALFGGKEGLEIIGRFLDKARGFLSAGGFIYLEFDPQQAGAFKQMLDGYGYKRYDFFKDQFGQVRFAKIFGD